MSEVQATKKKSKGDRVAYTIWHKDPPVDPHYDIIHEDDDLLVVSKSGNLPVSLSIVRVGRSGIAKTWTDFTETVNISQANSLHDTALRVPTIICLIV